MIGQVKYCYFTKLSCKIYYKLDLLASSFFTSQLQFAFVFLSISFLFLYVFFVSLFTIQMARKFDFVCDISPSKENWNIRVRIIRLWFVRDVNKDKLSHSLEIIIIDNKVVWHHFYYLFISIFILDNLFFFVHPFVSFHNFFAQSNMIPLNLFLMSPIHINKLWVSMVESSISIYYTFEGFPQTIYNGGCFTYLAPH
jgi:hypothetical protein